MMLFSNWDNKDSRDLKKGSNTSTIELSDGRRFQFVNDWGQSLGAWGRFLGRQHWNCQSYADQTPMFVAGVKEGLVSSASEVSIRLTSRTTSVLPTCFG